MLNIASLPLLSWLHHFGGILFKWNPVVRITNRKISNPNISPGIPAQMWSVSPALLLIITVSVTNQCYSTLFLRVLIEMRSNEWLIIKLQLVIWIRSFETFKACRIACPQEQDWKKHWLKPDCMLNNPWIYLPAPNTRQRCFHLEFVGTNNRTIYIYMYIIIYSEWILVLISDGCVQSELTNQHWPPNLLITKLKDWWQHLIFEWVQIISNWVSSHRHQKLALLKRKQKDFPESWCHPAPEIGPAVEFFMDFFFAAAQMHRGPGGKGAECQRADGCCRWSKRIRRRARFISCQVGRGTWRCYLPQLISAHSWFLRWLLFIQNPEDTCAGTSRHTFIRLYIPMAGIQK